jgi:hypothetical protein
MTKQIILAVLLAGSALAASIVNPNPVAGTFDKLWLTQADIHVAADYIQAVFVPYDGTDIIGSRPRTFNLEKLAAKQTGDAQLKAVMALLKSSVAEYAGNTSGIAFVSVRAPQPNLPVRVLVQFNDGKMWEETDAFKRCATDQQFAAVFLSVMGELARQAGYQVTQ